MVPLAAVIGAFLATAPQARADIVEFQLQDVTFGDGATLAGTFSVDETADTITLWHLVYTGGTDGVPTVTFSNGGTQTAAYHPDIGFDPQLTFKTASPPANFSEANFVVSTLLGDAGFSILVGGPVGPSTGNASAVGAVVFVTHKNHTAAFADIDPIWSGTIDPVPEPPTGLILAGGLGFFFLLARRALRRPSLGEPEATPGA